MSCFPCFGSEEKKAKKNARKDPTSGGSNRGTGRKKSENSKQKHSNDLTKKDAGNGNIAAQTFTFRELASATSNFLPDCLLGEGGFGRVYKGCLENSGQLVAVKQLDRNGLQGNREFLVEVLMLSLLHHQNLVNLIGYCADGDQRLLVYEFMPLGSLEDHLLDISPDQKPLDWYTRMKIASGAAQGLEYLHDKANPPVIYRDLKSSNILLDEEFNPKLSDFGLAKLGPIGDKVHVSSRVMGTYGYCAPEYARTGHLTLKSDVYSFGVVLLELISGRRAIDTTKPTTEQNLVTWAQPMFRDQKRFPELVDPLLQNDYPPKGLNQAVAVAAMCLQEEASVRPLIADVVMALGFLVDAPPTPQVSSAPPSDRPLPEERTEDDRRSSSHDESPEDSDRVIAIELGSNSICSQISQQGSGVSSSRRSKGSSRHGNGGSSSRRSKRSSRHGNGGSSSRLRKESSRHDNGDSSSSPESYEGSRNRSDGSSSKRSQGSSRYRSEDLGSKHYQGSNHGSGRSVSNWESQVGSGRSRSSSRHSKGSEHQSDLM